MTDEKAAYNASPQTKPTDIGTQLRSLMMLGHWAQERAKIDAAVRAVPEDPAEWATAGISSAVWASTVGEQLTEAIPGILADSELRPAAAVTTLIRTALMFGVEVGRQLEKREAASG